MGLLDYRKFLLNEASYYEPKYAKGGSEKLTFNPNTKETDLAQKLIAVGADPKESYVVVEEDPGAPTVTYKAATESVTIQDSNGNNFNIKATKGSIENLLTKATTGKTTTTTDVKEGMVVFFYYNQDLEDITPSDASLVSNIPPNAITANTRKQLENWIASYDGKSGTVSEWKSAAAALSAYTKAGFDMDRNIVLTYLKDLGSKISGLRPDNWCPADVMLVDSSAESSIREYVSTEKTIGELNLLFNTSSSLTPRSSSNDPIGSIVGVSLKQEDHRGGKAKEFLRPLSGGDAVYNLSREEVQKANSDPEWAKRTLSEEQEKLKQVAAEANITVNYTPSDVERLTPAQLKKKLAAARLLYHLLTLPNGDPANADDNLLGAYKFGRKQANPDVNPPYWKIVGKSKGDASAEYIAGGETIALLTGGHDSKETYLVIIDGQNEGFKLHYYVAVEDLVKEVTLKAGGGGGDQAKLEFEQDKVIGELGDGTTVAKVVQAYLARSK